MTTEYVFDIDGTLADATHRLHFIKDEAFFVNGKPDWDSFTHPELVAKDAAIPETWDTLTSLLFAFHARVIFITGRSEDTRRSTYDWLTDGSCETRALAVHYWRTHPNRNPVLFMRPSGDRRPSHIVKGEALERARMDGFNPTAVFEDRVDDTRMWRQKGLRCFQVAEGNY